MKKIITICITTTAILATIQADFSFGDMFKEMKEVAVSMGKDGKDIVASIENNSTVDINKSDTNQSNKKVTTDIKDINSSTKTISNSDKNISK